MNNTIKLLHWLPRAICILAISFVSIFALDAFGHGNPILDQILDFLMHLIPSFILLIFLIFTWKKELYGGIIFTVIGVGLSPIVYNHNYAMNNSISMSLGIIAAITFPFILVGILFIASHFLKKKHHLKYPK